MDLKEYHIEQAIGDLESGANTSIRAAAKAYGVPKSTLMGRLNTSRSHAFSHHLQRLSPLQEGFVFDWIMMEDAAGCPPTHARTRAMAIRILELGGDTAPLGKEWVSHFLHRNPRLASRIGRKLEFVRYEAADHDIIKGSLEFYHSTCSRLNIPPARTWNMDETGVDTGSCTNSRVLTKAIKRKAYYKSPENCEWMTVVEVVSAPGVKLRPVTIFKGKYLQTTWFPSIIPNWLYNTSQNGWKSNVIGVEWLKRVFIPKACQPKTWSVLIMASQCSHISIEFILLCKDHKIQVIYLPAHASHILQPLDLAPFSGLKHEYRSRLQELAAIDDAAPIKKDRFMTLYHEAR